jgi:hypothetical protein
MKKLIFQCDLCTREYATRPESVESTANVFRAMDENGRTFQMVVYPSIVDPVDPSIDAVGRCDLCRDCVIRLFAEAIHARV